MSPQALTTHHHARLLTIGFLIALAVLLLHAPAAHGIPTV